jgi:hypothetical protein
VLRLGPQAADGACVERADLAGFPARPDPARVVVRERRPMRLHLEVDARGPGPSFVAINQTWDSNWSATIDGAPALLARTEIALSGIAVPPGRHQIVLEYDDPWVSLGLLISLSAALTCLGLIVLARRRRG